MGYLRAARMGDNTKAEWDTGKHTIIFYSWQLTQRTQYLYWSTGYSIRVREKYGYGTLFLTDKL